VLAEAPAAFIAYDLLEREGVDCRGARRPSAAPRWKRSRRQHGLELSPRVEAQSWEDLARLREESRERGVEGSDAQAPLPPTGSGAARTSSGGANWWKWKIDPYSVDAVLVYAQPGNGRRASLYTDYTFARRCGAAAGERTLVPFAKAYSGLTDEEIRQVDAIVRRTTVEKFGPVRSLAPTQVFEIGFEGIQRSPRHKSGIAVRFPRMLKWRRDKPVEEADTLATLRGAAGRADRGLGLPQVVAG
jgi:DNA ligase 1